MLTAQLEQAIAAFSDCVDANLNPSLTAITWPADGHAEYDVLIAGQSSQGVLHEEIVQAAEIADTHGGRLFLGGPDGKLAIVWPLSRDAVPGPGDPSPAETERVAARGRRASTR